MRSTASNSRLTPEIHTPQSLRASSPNLGEQITLGFFLGELGGLRGLEHSSSRVLEFSMAFWTIGHPHEAIAIATWGYLKDSLRLEGSDVILDNWTIFY